MTNNTAAPKVAGRRHKYFISFPGEKRTVLTTRKAKALLAELDTIAKLDGEWLMENFDSDDFVEAPLYAVSIFQRKHSGEDLIMLRAWLQDALLGWDGGYESHVSFLTRIRRDAEAAFADFD